MKDEKDTKYRIGFLIVMASFGCIGPIVKNINLPTPVLACLRAAIASAVLWVFILIFHNNWDRGEIKKSLTALIISGAMIATGNWIGLFAAYKYTTVATATVVFYTSTILVCIMSVIILREKLTLRHTICIIVAFIGLALVSGVLGSSIRSSEFTGILFAFMGAVTYAGIVIINRKYPSGDSVVRCAIQLSAGTASTLIYNLIVYGKAMPIPTSSDWLYLLLLGVVFTAFAYIFYFDYILRIPTRSVAIFSYADPVVACLISVFFLSEPMTSATLIGTVLIIGASLVSELF